MEREEFLAVYRHSLAHILAKAVIELFGKENVQYAIGPEIADGFYYDFLLPRTVTAEDKETIENKMREILKRKEDWTCKEMSKAEALELFADQKFKVELIEELPEEEPLTVYWTGDDFVDLCRGPHVSNSQELLSAAFQLKSVSGSYWRGDEKLDQLQRIYFYAFPDKQALKEHLAMIREAMERDHKVIGPQLELFMFDETSPGMPYWLPKGWKTYTALMEFWRRIHERHGYQEISGPILANKVLWKTSGHWDHYRDNMFLSVLDRETLKGEKPVDLEEDLVFAAKPMNCPSAINVYKHTQRSYKELPLRFSETDVIHRREKSGELNGLFRVQEFRQDDDHTFLMKEQIGEEIADIMKIADEIYSTFGLTYRAELSTRPEDHMGAEELWDEAESTLKAILDAQYGPEGYEINEGDGAFYGPKIDIMMKDCIGREWQMGTIQLDFQLPLNFDLKYVAADGTIQQPVLIHRAILGSFERFMGIIIENFKGAFPFWLAPVQVGIVPIRVEHNDYAKEIADLLFDAGLRYEADYTDRNMKDKIKYFKQQKVPYIIVLGDREKEERTVSVNLRGGNRQMQNVPLDVFLKICREMVEKHMLELIDSVEEK